MATTDNHAGVNVPLVTGKGAGQHTWRIRQNPVLVAQASVIALLATAVFGAQPVWGGTYVMRNCNVPGAKSAPVGPWQPTPAPHTVRVDQCQSGGGFGFALSAAARMNRNTYATWDLALPAEGPQSAITLSKMKVWLDPRLKGLGSPIRVAMRGTGGGPVQDGVVIEPPGYVDSHVHALRANSSAFHIYLICADEAGTGQDCFPEDTIPLQITGVEATLSESVPPSGALLGGTLLEPGPQSGVREIQFSAQDLESGLTKVELLLGETVVVSRDLRTRCSYVDFRACAAADEGSMRVDTATIANGTHTLMLRMYDAAGNEQLVRAPGSVHVTNAPAHPASKSSDARPESTGMRLTARFARTSRRTLTVAFNARPVVRGRVDTELPQLGLPMIKITERSMRPGEPRLVSTLVRTRADGSFSYALQARRSSRSIRVSHQPTAIGKAVVANNLNLKVRAAARLYATLRGSVIRFGGRVLSGPVPRSGKRVTLQGRAPGYAWATFAALRTDRKGRFSGRYGLPVRRPGVKIEVRASVPRERAYPYEAYVGRPVTLRVR